MASKTAPLLGDEENGRRSESTLREQSMLSSIAGSGTSRGVAAIFSMLLICVVAKYSSSLLGHGETAKAKGEAQNLLGIKFEYQGHNQFAAVMSAAAVVGVTVTYLMLIYCVRENTHSSEHIKAHHFSHTMRKSTMQINKMVEKRLDMEKYADVGCFSHLINRPWTTVPQEEVPIVPLTPNKEWMENKVFPDGEVRGTHIDEDKDMWSLIFAFWRFLWKRNTSWLSVGLMVLEGLIGPLIAQIIGQAIGEMSTDGSQAWLAFYCVCAWILYMINARAEFVFQVEVPGANIKQELSFRIQRQFLGMSGALAEDWPAGRCAAVQNYDVVKAVGMAWCPLFDIIKNATSLTVIVILLFWNIEGVFFTASAFVMFVALFVGTWLSGRLRRQNYVDLAMRQRNWELGWSAYATRQVEEAREGKCDGKLHATPDELAQALGNMGCVYSNRAFHYYLSQAMAALGPDQLTFFCTMLVTFIAGQQAIRGEMTVGDAASLVGVINTLGGSLTAWVTIQLSIYEGYASILELVEVFNYDVD